MGAKLARDAGASVHQGPRRLYRGQALLPQSLTTTAGLFSAAGFV
ncbi:hypothetical protein AK973_3823 [Pseudomonas brassicacearum]|nr:hypothetical protein AK973_3823 [Pseudomonas brassicacearum]